MVSAWRQHFRWLLFAGTLLLAVWLLLRAGWALAPAALGAVTLHVLLVGQVTYRLQNFPAAFMLVTAFALQGWWRNRRLGLAGWLFPALVGLWANLHGGRANGSSDADAGTGT